MIGALLLIAALGAAFLFQVNRKANTPVGRIFGQKITYERYQKTYLHLKAEAVLTYGEMADKLESLLNLEREVWDRLITLHEAQKRRINVSNDDVVKEIEKSKIGYNKEGEFSLKDYRMIIRRAFQMDPREFEESIREELILQKLFDQAAVPVKVSDEEVLINYKNNNEKLQLSTIEILAKDFLDKIKINPPEIESYYQEHKNDFFKPPSINVEYIYLEFPPEGGVQKEVENKFKAYAIYNDHIKKADLKPLGIKYHYPSKETGYFTKTEPNMDPHWRYEMMLQAFEMEIGRLSQPIELDKGYLVFKVTGKKGPHVSPLIEVKGKVEEKIKQERAQKEAEGKAKEYLAAIQKELAQGQDKTFKTAAEGLKLKVDQSKLATKETLLSDLDILKEAEPKIFALHDQNKLSEVVPTFKGALVAFVERFEPADQGQFEKERETLKKDLIEEKKNESTSRFLKDLRRNAQLEIFNPPD